MSNLPKSSRKHQRILHIVVVATTISLLAAVAWLWIQVKPLERLQQIDPGLHRVTAVHDGDTISVMINGKDERVRLLAIDTPETHHPEIGAECYGAEAGQRLRQIIGDSKLRLEADPKADNRDYYDRLLRYVYLPDGTLVNAQMVREGYALAYTGFANSETPQIIALEEQARSQGLGLWSACEVTKDGRSWSTQQIDLR